MGVLIVGGEAVVEFHFELPDSCNNPVHQILPINSSKFVSLSDIVEMLLEPLPWMLCRLPHALVPFRYMSVKKIKRGYFIFSFGLYKNKTWIYGLTIFLKVYIILKKLVNCTVVNM